MKNMKITKEVKNYIYYLMSINPLLSVDYVYNYVVHTFPHKSKSREIKGNQR